jgi:hypothetical protein
MMCGGFALFDYRGLDFMMCLNNAHHAAVSRGQNGVGGD